MGSFKILVIILSSLSFLKSELYRILPDNPEKHSHEILHSRLRSRDGHMS